MAVQWLRVVLDEGHTIKNPAARQTVAALKLKAERRWVVSGTPLQVRGVDVLKGEEGRARLAGWGR
jgi:SWI/SNF-related matrix-associated actin-dependent regulator of chromatin subfamily A3